MRNEQSLLLAVRHQLSALGYTESEIDAQDSAIEHFAKLVINSINLERRRQTYKPDTTGYEYYMHINDPNFSTWEHDALMSTFDSPSDWSLAVERKDLATCNAIIGEVEKFCKTHRVPSAVVDFYKEMPALLAVEAWNELQYNGIVDAYCDEDSSEYVDGITGEE